MIQLKKKKENDNLGQRMNMDLTDKFLVMLVVEMGSSITEVHYFKTKAKRRQIRIVS